MSYTVAQQRELTLRSSQILKSDEPSHALEAAGEVTDLIELIRYHEWRYYVINDPVLSDKEFDELFARLRKIETAFPELLSSDSPTQQVSSDLSSPSAKESGTRHLTPMLSLANSYDEADLLSFDEQVHKLTGRDIHEDIEYVVEPKFDGGSIAIVYENDLLVRAATRGNGTQGEEMTANAKVIEGIPHKVAFSSKGMYKVEVRGEALIRKNRFDAINAQRVTAGQALFANPRNAATGGLRTKDPAETKSRQLEAFIYTLGYAADKEGNNLLDSFSSHHDSIELLHDLGFQTPKEGTKVCKNIAEVVTFIQSWEARRDSYEYEIDGMVVKVNDLHLQNLSGSTSHHPRWAIAFKFKARQATTTLLNVDYQVGKTGSITPVARLQPVALGGVTVSNVSLHNEEFIRSRDIRIGDRLVVERAGDVIPYIVKSLADLRDGSEKPVVFPETCPSCESKLVKPEDEAVWRCENASCEAQVLQRIMFHVSKEAMDIEGFGPALVERFFQMGWIKTIADIYTLDQRPIANLEGFKQKSADNLIQNLAKARQNPLHRLINSLSIHHLGKKGSQLLAAEVEYLLDLAQWPVERYLEIKEFGPVLAQNVHAFFSEASNIQLLQAMESNGVNMRQTEEDKPAESAATGPLAGKTILFTGTLSTQTREQAEKTAASLGATIASSVSKNLSILVVGEKAGSKLEKAQKINTITILSEAEFVLLTENNNQ